MNEGACCVSFMADQFTYADAASFVLTWIVHD